MNITAANATPSALTKRRQSEENHLNKTNDDYHPKKKRESAIRSENNLKLLIQNKQVNCKHKVSSKKVLSLRKEVRTETLEMLISAAKFDKLEKLYNRTVASESQGYTKTDDPFFTDDSDSNDESETPPPPDKISLEPESQNMPTKQADNLNTNLVLESDIIPEVSITPLPWSDGEDSGPNQISSTSNHDENIDLTSNESLSSLNAEVAALQNLIRNLAPAIDEAKELSEKDIKQLECIYNTILDVKRRLNAVYQEKSMQLKKTFESIQILIPELKKDLTLPASQESKEREKRLNNEELSSYLENPSEPPEASSQSPTSSMSSSKSVMTQSLRDKLRGNFRNNYYLFDL